LLLTRQIRSSRFAPREFNVMTRWIYKPGYARRPRRDWLTPFWLKVAIALACVAYLVCWCVLMAR
jgi:hypothetical protein